MQKDGGSTSGGGRGSSRSGEGAQSCVKVIQGPSRKPLRTSHKISNGEVEELRWYFFKVLEFLEAVTKES